MRAVLLVAVLALVAGCSSDDTPPTVAAPASTSTSTSTSTTPVAPTTTTMTVVATTTTTTVAPGGLTAADLPSSWRPGCPVGPAELRKLQIPFWGFDDAAHIGTLVVHASVADAVRKVFAQLYDAHFPIRRMEPIDVYGGEDERSLEADNTAGFNCRAAVVSGPPHWSVHAYGKAIDVNPVENPYIEGGRVHPQSGADYVRRTPERPGMAVPGGVLVRAFASVGWQWGGRWTGTPDYQHFSSTGG